MKNWFQSFAFFKFNLYRYTKDMPKTLLLPYQNYEAYGQPRTFSTAAPPSYFKGSPLKGAGAGGGAGAGVGAGVGGGSGSPASHHAAAGGAGMGLPPITNANGVATPSWMGPR